MLLERVHYRAQVKATLGRDIRVVSSDSALDLRVTIPHELGGTDARGSNPEQLFAASYAASFLGMMRSVAARDRITLPTRTAVEALVALGPTGRSCGIEVEVRIWLPGLPRAEADSLVKKAHAFCPYSNATRGNITVRLVLA
jgi:lipoyl-dependent peroxiredoxin